MSGRGLHVSPAVYRARRRFVAALGATVLVLTGTAAYRVVSTRGGPDEVAAAEVGPAEVGPAEVGPAEVGPAVAGPRPIVTPVVPRPTGTPAGSTPPRSAPRAGVLSPAPRAAPAVAVVATHPTTDPTERRPDAPALPSSGTGRRIVYSIGHQRVWLVAGTDRVVRSYRVSGARSEYVAPGTFHVYSRSTLAVAWDHESTMRWMVRFARGPRTNIGFHEIPVMDDSHRPAQTPAQLGTPLSDGCIRQATSDAEALYSFAPVGTTVVVTA